MALDPLYGSRMRQYAQEANPALFAPPPELQIERRPLNVPAPSAGMPASAAPTGPSGFPALVAQTQGSGAKLDAAALEALKERYLTETVMPRETARKGSTKQAHEAAAAAFDSKASRWIQDYLKDPETAGPAPDGSGASFGLGRTLRGVADTAVRALQGATADTASGILSAADYSARSAQGNAGTVAGAAAVLPRLLSGEITPKQAYDMISQARTNMSSQATPLAGAADAVSKAGDEIGGALISDQTQAAAKGLEDLMQRDAPVSEIAKYIASNPSAASDMLGQTLGFLAPALFTGGASAGIRSSALAGNLARGGLGSRVAGRALENAPGIVASGIAPTFDSVGQLRRFTDTAPLSDLLQSEPNLELYEGLQELGLEGARLNTRFREALLARGEDATLAGSAAANLLIPGALGAPAERLLAGAATRPAGRGLVNNALRTGAAEGGQEAVAAVPETIGSNIGQSGVTGQEIDPLQGVGNNMALGAGLGALVGGGLSPMGRPVNPLRGTRQGASGTTTVETPDTPAARAAAQNAGMTIEGEATVVPPTPAAPTGFVAETIVATPGTGVEAEAHGTYLNGITEAATRNTARKNTKRALGQMDAEGVLAQAQAIAQREAGDTWNTMTADQRLTGVETAAEVLNKVSKQDIAPVLAAVRNGMQTAPTPAGTDTTVTPPVETAPAVDPPPVEAQPAPVVSEPAAPAPTPAVEVAPQAPAQAADAVSATLPKELAGAKPRYANGTANYAPQFESDIDKAFYIIGQTTKSKRDADYRKFLTSQGFTSSQLDNLAPIVRAAVRAQMEQTPGGTPLSPARVPMPTTNVLTQRTESAPKTKRKNPLAKPKETQSPKDDAPVEQPGQAQANLDTPPAEQTTTQPSGTRETTAEAVNRIAPDLLPADSEAVSQALELAREGDNSELSSTLNELVKNEELTRAQAADIRRAGQSLSAAQEGLTNTDTTPVEAPPVDEPTETPGVDPDAYTPSSEATFTETAVSNALRSDSENKAGDLLRALSNGPQSEIGTSQRWLAGKVADILDSVDVELVPPDPKYPNVGGAYSFRDNAMWFNKATPEIIVHEALHGVTSSALASRRPEVQEFSKELDDLMIHVQRFIEQNPSRVSKDVLARSKQKTGFLSNNREFLAYGMTSPNIQDFLASIPAPKSRANARNAWEAFKDLIAQMYTRLADMGLLTTEQRSSLDALIETTAGLVDLIGDNPTIATSGNQAIVDAMAAVQDTYSPIDPQVPSSVPLTQEADARTVTRAQRLIETLAQAGYGLEVSEQEVRKAGGIVTPETSPYYASRKYTSDIAENRTTDNLEIAQPIQNWIAENWRNFDVTDIEQFRTDLDKFLQNYHTLNERNPSIWAETVPLRNGMELRRGELIDDAYDGSITGQELATELRALADQYATESLDAWAKKNPARNPDTAQRVLADVATRGFTADALADFNTLLTNARNRTQQRMRTAGIISESDPFADRGWNWYVPLKGNLAVDEATADYDYGSNVGKAKEFRNRNVATMQGRSTNADNALEQLLVDMNQAASAEAEAGFKGTLFEYVSDNEGLLGANIKRYEGTPKEGYTSENGKRVKELPNPKYGFIYNDGTNHYEVTLPERSQLDRGIKGLRRVIMPSTFEQAGNPLAPVFTGLGTATNVMARAYTTWSPDWQLMIGFLRDVQTLPTTIAVEAFDSPWKARVFFTQYAKNLIGNTASMMDMKRALNEIGGRRDKLAAFLEDPANADSYIAKLFAYRDAGGSTEFAQGLNREKAGDLLFGKARMQEADFLSPTTARRAYDTFNELTSNWAALLENRGRVASWEALIAAGKSPEEAAALTKGSLDYGQSGEWGKMINIWHAFYRVGATSVDTMRRAFTTPDGNLDMPKIGKWMPFFGAMGALNYTIMAALLGDDEDGEPRIKKYTADTIAQKMVFPTGEDGKAFAVPVGLGLPMLVLAPGTLGAAVAAGHLTPEEAGKAYYEVIDRNAPVQAGGIKPNSGATGFASAWLQGILAPSFLEPIVESERNVNAFGSPIRTGFNDTSKFASDQGMPNTPPEWKEMAGWLRETTGIDMYPETIRHFGKAYGGQPANMVMRWTVDRTNNEQQGIESSAVRTAMRLGVNDEDFYYRNEARKALNTLELSKRRVENAKRRGESEAAWLRANRNDARRLTARADLDKARDAYYKRKAAIRDNNLMSQQGKQEQIKLADAALRKAVDRANAVIGATKE